MIDEPYSVSAVGKCILCGEHAVVYGQPAIALPVAAVRATAQVLPAGAGAGLTVEALDLGLRWRLGDEAPLAALLRETLATLEAPEPDMSIALRSSVPIARGMGSGAAVATALVRALARAAGRSLAPNAVAALVYQSERAFHGTPSGIDNTVIAYEQPIWFQRQPEGEALLEPLRAAGPLQLVIGDTGVHSETRASVGDLRRRWQTDQQRYERRFQAIGALVVAARAALEAGDALRLGPLLNANQVELEALELSSPELDRLVTAARAAGALGAKLSGGGWGGIMLALASGQEQALEIATALGQAGASRTIVASVG